MKLSKTMMNRSNKKFSKSSSEKMLQIISKVKRIKVNLQKVNLYLYARKKVKRCKNKEKAVNKDGRVKAKISIMRMKCCLNKYNKCKVKRMFVKILYSKKWKNNNSSMIKSMKLIKRTKFIKLKANR
jgi:hypothetical protein